ncbi:hypothetical protein ACFPFV_08240 [Salinicoccus siamensis]|uniref:hypothetical protein n=1 Tax=Salinicoccus siamensis TaxID=381830 RepID=UPI00360ABD44
MAARLYRCTAGVCLALQKDGATQKKVKMLRLYRESLHQKGRGFLYVSFWIADIASDVFGRHR